MSTTPLRFLHTFSSHVNQEANIHTNHPPLKRTIKKGTRNNKKKIKRNVKSTQYMEEVSIQQITTNQLILQTTQSEVNQLTQRSLTNSQNNSQSTHIAQSQQSVNLIPQTLHIQQIFQHQNIQNTHNINPDNSIHNSQYNEATQTTYQATEHPQPLLTMVETQKQPSHNNTLIALQRSLIVNEEEFEEYHTGDTPTRQRRRSENEIDYNAEITIESTYPTKPTSNEKRLNYPIKVFLKRTSSTIVDLTGFTNDEFDDIFDIILYNGRWDAVNRKYVKQRIDLNILSVNENQILNSKELFLLLLTFLKHAFDYKTLYDIFDYRKRSNISEEKQICKNSKISFIS
ncbi:hypothetical protein EIN_251730, partial [Entamoeba invadens IP1]